MTSVLQSDDEDRHRNKVEEKELKLQKTAV